MEGCALILHFFTASTSLHDKLDSHRQPEMLELASVPQNKSLRAVQGAFGWTAKQVIMDPIPTVDEHHLLIGLKEEMVVSHKKTPENRVVKKEARTWVRG